ncbi:MAG: Dabb family protein [Acidobacteria bacterium]|nr:Dabb family protein [Acidobacteriota bacterium]
MLIHIVCWKYKPEVPEARREEHRDRLMQLSQLVPNLARLDVGADILHLDRSYDTALVAEFESREALDAYTEHPDHQKVAAMGRELAEKAVSVDFWA